MCWFQNGIMLYCASTSMSTRTLVVVEKHSTEYIFIQGNSMICRSTCSNLLWAIGRASVRISYRYVVRVRTYPFFFCCCWICTHCRDRMVDRQMFPLTRIIVLLLSHRSMFFYYIIIFLHLNMVASHTGPFAGLKFGWNWLKILFRLNYCERKILFRLKKEAEQAGYGVSRTGLYKLFSCSK